MGIRKRANAKRAKNCSMRVKKGNKKSQTKILRGPNAEKWDIKKTLRENYDILGLNLNVDEHMKRVTDLDKTATFKHTTTGGTNRPTSVFFLQ